VSTLPKLQRHACGVEGARRFRKRHPAPLAALKNKSWSFENLISDYFSLTLKTFKFRFSGNYSAESVFTVGFERPRYG
jgi:hypothetical protein